jgi:hypothetical protein
MHAASTIFSSYAMSGYSRRRATLLEEQAVAHLHDVGLVNRRHLLAPVRRAYSKANLRDARRALLRDDLQALDDAGNDLVLEPGIEVLGVLAHDDQIDAWNRAARRQVPHRPEIRVEVERLAQADVHAREPVADRRGHRPFQRHLVAPDGSSSSTGSGRRPFDREHAGVVALPLDGNA